MDRACDGCGEQMHDLYELKGEMLCVVCYEIAEIDDEEPHFDNND